MFEEAESQGWVLNAEIAPDVTLTLEYFELDEPDFGKGDFKYHLDLPSAKQIEPLVEDLTQFFDSESTVRLVKTSFIKPLPNKRTGVRIIIEGNASPYFSSNLVQFLKIAVAFQGARDFLPPFTLDGEIFWYGIYDDQWETKGMNEHRYSLFKYTLSERDTLTFKRETRILDSSIFSNQKDGKKDAPFSVLDGIFLTLTQFKDDMYQMKDSLAITYTPYCEYELDLTQLNMGAFSLLNPLGEENPSRIWPAFGHYGGGWEIILVPKTKISKQGARTIPLEFKRRFEVPPGAIPEPFCQNSVLEGDFVHVMGFLAEAIFDWFTAPFGLDEEHYITISQSPLSPAMKIIGNQGVVVSWSEDRHFSISCSLRDVAFPSPPKPPLTQLVQLEFWGYVWEDINGTRYLSYPKFCPKHLELSEFKSAKEINDQNKGLLNRPVGGALGEIFTALFRLNKNFRETRLDKYFRETGVQDQFMDSCELPSL